MSCNKKSILSFIYDIIENHEIKALLQLVLYMMDYYPQYNNITFLFINKSYSRINILLQNGIVPLTVKHDFGISFEMSIIINLLVLFNDPIYNNSLISWFSIISYIKDNIDFLLQDICQSAYFTTQINSIMVDQLIDKVKLLLNKLDEHKNNKDYYTSLFVQYFNLDLQDFE